MKADPAVRHVGRKERSRVVNRSALTALGAAAVLLPSLAAPLLPTVLAASDAPLVGRGSAQSGPANPGGGATRGNSPSNPDGGDTSKPATGDGNNGCGNDTS